MLELQRISGSVILSLFSHILLGIFLAVAVAWFAGYCKCSASGLGWRRGCSLTPLPPLLLSQCLRPFVDTLIQDCKGHVCSISWSSSGILMTSGLSPPRWSLCHRNALPFADPSIGESFSILNQYIFSWWAQTINQAVNSFTAFYGHQLGYADGSCRIFRKRLLLCMPPVNTGVPANSCHLYWKCPLRVHKPSKGSSFFMLWWLEEMRWGPLINHII